MKKKTGYGLTALTCTMLATIILAEFLMTGCPIQHAVAVSMGLNPDAPVPQHVYREIKLKPTITWSELERYCGKSPEWGQKVGCAIWDNTTHDGYCIIVYTEGDLITRAHERCHCREGHWHNENGIPLYPGICEGVTDAPIQPHP